jgi:hypothetical protein
MVARNELGFIAVLPTMIAPLAVNQGIAEIVSLKRGAFVFVNMMRSTSNFCSVCFRNDHFHYCTRCVCYGCNDERFLVVCEQCGAGAKCNDCVREDGE